MGTYNNHRIAAVLLVPQIPYNNVFTLTQSPLAAGL